MRRNKLRPSWSLLGLTALLLGAVAFTPASGQTVTFSEYGSGTPGTNGRVPALKGVDGPCIADGYSVNLTNALPDSLGFLWLSDQQASLPFACGELLVDPSSFFVPVPVKLDSFGSLTILGPDACGAAGSTFHLQGLILDSGACKSVALTNGLTLSIQ